MSHSANRLCRFQTRLRSACLRSAERPCIGFSGGQAGLCGGFLAIVHACRSCGYGKEKGGQVSPAAHLFLKLYQAFWPTAASAAAIEARRLATSAPIGGPVKRRLSKPNQITSAKVMKPSTIHSTLSFGGWMAI